MKKFIVLLAGLLSAVSLQAATISTSLTDNTLQNVKTTGFALTSVTFANAGATAASVALWDTSATNLYQSIGAYTNSTSYTTNIVTLLTLPSGVIQTNTNTGTFTYATTVAANTNSVYTKKLFMVIPASTTTTYTPVTPIVFTFGLTYTNASTNVTVNVSTP